MSSSLTFWREKIAKSIKKNKKFRGYKFVQFATVESKNFSNQKNSSQVLVPKNRTIVFRGWLSDYSRGFKKNEGKDLIFRSRMISSTRFHLSNIDF